MACSRIVLRLFRAQVIDKAGDVMGLQIREDRFDSGTRLQIFI